MISSRITHSVRKHSTSVKRNENLMKLSSNYLFPEITKRRNEYLALNPSAKIISLGKGDTTQPIPAHILSGLLNGASKLGTKSGYSGYTPEQGIKILRDKISEKLYNKLINPNDIFVSDGSKCDISRLQLMFGSKVVSAVQDPSYPVYVDTRLKAIHKSRI
jgi:LL-diaminopimelate aminotransferase